MFAQNTSIFRGLLVAGLLSSLAALPAAAQSQNDVIERSKDGTVRNWSGGYVEVTAQGSSKETGNDIQMEQLALAAARLSAEVKMVKAIDSVRVTGLTEMKNYQVTNAIFASRVKGILRGAIAIKEEIKWIRSRRANVELPLATVVLRMCYIARSQACEGRGRGLMNAFSKTDLAPEAYVVPARPVPKAAPAVAQPAEQPAPKVSATPAPAAAEEQKQASLATAPAKTMPAKTMPAKAIAPVKPSTALIVDLGSKVYLPVLIPQIRTTKNDSVYDGRRVDSDIGVNEGLAAYVNSMAAARKLARTGGNPIVVSPKRVDENNHIIVSEGDGDRILSANKLGGDFLRKARVIIVVQN